MNKLSATLKSIEEKTVTKDDNSEVKTWTAVFEEDGAKIRIARRPHSRISL